MNDLIQKIEVFSDAFLPPKLIYREKEVSQIELALERGAGNIAIFGASGVGKTATLRWVLNRNSDTFHTFIHCTHNFTRKNLLLHLAQHLHIPCNPKKDNADIITEKISPNFKKSSFFVILDDIDRLKPTERCSILKLADIFSNMSFIICTNRLGLLVKLKDSCPDILTRLSPTNIYFNAYDIPQISDILQARCKEGLKYGAYEEGDIKGLAAYLKRKTEGDVRAGIRAIRVAADNATIEGKNRITFESLTDALDTVMAENLIEVIGNLSSHEKILLISVLQRVGTFTCHLKRYRTMASQLFFEPLNRSNVWRSFNRLAEAGLIYPMEKGHQTIYYPLIEDEKQKRELIKKIKVE